MSNNENNTKFARSVNVFDVLIPIILIACIVGLVLRSCSNDSGTIEQTEVAVYFTVDDVTQDVLNSITENDSIYINAHATDEEILIGKMSDNNIEDTNSLFRINNKIVDVINKDGSTDTVYYPDGTLCVAKGKMIATGLYDANHGFTTTDGGYLTPGQSVTLYTESAVLDVVITRIDLE